MAYTMEQANALLANIQTEAELRALVSQLDITSTGKVTVLYSGMVADTIYSGSLIQSMVTNGEDIRVLDMTEASKFLDWKNNDAFADALERVFDGARPGDVGSTANQFLQGGVDANGIRIPNGAWDDVSKRFVAATTGDIRTITPFADPNRVFAQTELLVALNNPNVTSIDGVSKQSLLALYNDELAKNGTASALNTLREAVTASSWVNTRGLDVVTDANGAITDIGSKSFFDGTAITGDSLAADTPNKTSLSAAMGELSEVQRTSLIHGQEALVRAGALTTALDHAGSVLNKAGVIGTVLGLSLVAGQAQAAWGAGDHVGAANILRDWAVGATGGFAGGVLAAESAAVFSRPCWRAGLSAWPRIRCWSAARVSLAPSTERKSHTTHWTISAGETITRRTHSAPMLHPATMFLS